MPSITVTEVLIKLFQATAVVNRYESLATEHQQSRPNTISQGRYSQQNDGADNERNERTVPVMMPIHVDTVVGHESDEDSPTHRALRFQLEVKPWVLDLLASQLGQRPEQQDVEERNVLKDQLVFLSATP